MSDVVVSENEGAFVTSEVQGIREGVYEPEALVDFVAHIPNGKTSCQGGEDVGSVKFEVTLPYKDAVWALDKYGRGRNLRIVIYPAD